VRYHRFAMLSVVVATVLMGIGGNDNVTAAPPAQVVRSSGHTPARRKRRRRAATEWTPATTPGASIRRSTLSTRATVRAA